jgi:hypothetical protein
MKKWMVALYIGMAVLVCPWGFGPANGQEEIVNLQDSAFVDHQRPAAAFNHDQHNETAELEECNVCHHVYEGGKKVEDDSSEGQACSDCHHVEKDHPARPLMKAYHDLCKQCHRANEKGPVTCGECHPKM